jgi:hypothetical protein
MVKNASEENSIAEKIEREFMPDQCGRFKKQIDFILEADRLKQTLRRTLLMDRSRRENSAEHSWLWFCRNMPPAMQLMFFG